MADCLPTEGADKAHGKRRDGEETGGDANDVIDSGKAASREKGRALGKLLADAATGFVAGAAREVGAKLMDEILGK